MNKVLSQKEALEIINTLREEYLFSPVKIHWARPSRYQDRPKWCAFSKSFREWTFLGITIQWRRTKTEAWCFADTLEGLVEVVERELSQHDNRIVTANAIRTRHATRLLDKEIRK